MICSGGAVVGNMRVTVKIAVPQHRADLLGDAPDDPAAHHPPAGVAAEIGFGERPGHAGERSRFEGQLEKGREPFQRGDARPRRSRPPHRSTRLNRRNPSRR